jgi:hypothetical protein
MTKGVFKDLSGKRYGRLVVLRRTVNKKSFHPMWECQCDCGEVCVVRGSSLTSTKETAQTRSCGCLHMVGGNYDAYYYEVDGIKDTIAGHARRVGLSPSAMRRRVLEWQNTKAALTMPPRESMRRTKTKAAV